MPYENNEDLPKSVTDPLPPHAQTIYRKAFNSAWDQYDTPEKRQGDSGREETAHKVAWSAVKESYRKDSEKWVKKEEHA